MILKRIEASVLGLEPSAEVMEMPIEDLDLSVRSFNCLKRAGINTVADLIAKSKDELMQIKYFNQKTFDEVESKLDELGIKLRSNTVERIID